MIADCESEEVCFLFLELIICHICWFVEERVISRSCPFTLEFFWNYCCSIAGNCLFFSAHLSYSYLFLTHLLLQEIISIYPLLFPPTLSPAASNRVCNALALLQVQQFWCIYFLFFRFSIHSDGIWYWQPACLIVRLEDMSCQYCAPFSSNKLICF